MLDTDISKRERNLERDISDWKLGEEDRARRRSKALAELRSLEPRAAEIRNTINELRHEEQLVRGAIATANQEVAAEYAKWSEIKAEITRLEKFRAAAVTENEVRERELAAKYEAYEQVKKEEFEDFLADMVLKTSRAQTEYDELELRIKAATEAAEGAEQARAETEANCKKVTTELTQEALDMAEDNNRLKTENQKLITDNVILAAENADLKAKNVDLDQARDKFAAYEQKALAALEATDNSLRKREQAVAEREQHRAPIKSFLPPVDD